MGEGTKYLKSCLEKLGNGEVIKYGKGDEIHYLVVGEVKDGIIYGTIAGPHSLNARGIEKLLEESEILKFGRFDQPQ